jgi:hypothetical protein
MGTDRNELIRSGTDLLSRINSEILVSSSLSNAVKVQRLLESAAPAIGMRWSYAIRGNADSADEVWQELFNEPSIVNCDCWNWDNAPTRENYDRGYECDDAISFVERDNDLFVSRNYALESWNPTPRDQDVLDDPPDGILPDVYADLSDSAQTVWERNGDDECECGEPDCPFSSPTEIFDPVEEYS